jgi:NADH-quinone oxidoreductase subunit G
VDQIAPGEHTQVEALAAGDTRFEDVVFGAVVDDFYQTNPIARASAIMSELSALAHEHDHGATGTDG